MNRNRVEEPIRPVKFRHYALDETPQGEVVLRGVLVPDTLEWLRVGAYQRELLPDAVRSIAKALQTGSVPDIELGMRGESMDERDGHVLLLDPVFIIDGQQRVGAARFLLEGGVGPHLGATVHFKTTEEWERERFRVLNLDRTKLSPNVVLRSWQPDFPVVDLLMVLCSDRSFAMKGRITWNQRMTRDELITAATYFKVVGELHSHLGSAARANKIAYLVQGLQRIYTRINRTAMRENIKTFFEVLDGAFGVQRIVYRERAVYIRGTFLMALARVLSNHLTFWDGNRLVVDKATIQKLQSFPLQDPTVIQLASSSGQISVETLARLMTDHINSGRRTRRLVPRQIFDVPLGDDEVVDDLADV